MKAVAVIGVALAGLLLGMDRASLGQTPQAADLPPTLPAPEPYRSPGATPVAPVAPPVVQFVAPPAPVRVVPLPPTPPAVPVMAPVRSPGLPMPMFTAPATPPFLPVPGFGPVLSPAAWSSAGDL